MTHLLAYPCRRSPDDAAHAPPSRPADSMRELVDPLPRPLRLREPFRIVAEQPGVVVLDHRRAGARRCDDRVVAVELREEMLGRRAGLRLVPGVERRLAAARLSLREYRLGPEPSQQPHRRLPRLGEEGVDEAGAEEQDFHEEGLLPFAEQVAQRRPEFRETEPVAGLLKAARDHARARQQQGVRHLAPHREAEGEGRDRKRRGARQGLSERLGKLPVGDRARRDGVDRAAQIAALQRMEDDEGKVVEGDPADVLTPAADHAPEPRPEQREHPRKRPPLRREDHPDPQCHDADPLPSGRRGGRLPLPADLGEISRAGLTLLGQRLLSPVAVITDRGGAHDRLRRPGEPREGVAENARPVHTAVPDGGLPGGVPPAGADVLARQVEYGIEPLEPRRIDLPFYRVPPYRLLPGGGRASDQADNLMSRRRQERSPPRNPRAPSNP